MWRAERPEGHSTIATESHIKSAESQGCDTGTLLALLILLILLY